MIFFAIVSLVILASVLAYVRWNYRECLKCTLASVFAMLLTLFLSNVLYTGFLNFDAGDADRNSAIVMAVCNPVLNAVKIPEDISCAPKVTAYGVDLVVFSYRLLSDSEVKIMIDRVRMLKPIITSGRVQLQFEKINVRSSVPGATKDGAAYKTTSYSGDVYKTINL